MQRRDPSTHRPTNRTTGKQASQPEPLGVIAALTAGFDFVTRHPELMLLPILLDVFLWLGPRLLAYPIFNAIKDLFNSPDMLAAMQQGQSQQLEAATKLLDQLGQTFNLFWWLSPTLLGVPALTVGAPDIKVPNGQPTIWPVSDGLAYAGLFVVLSVIGLGLSAAYWGMLASSVREQGLSVGNVAQLWWRLVKIAGLYTLVAFIIGLPTLLVAAVLSLFNPLIGQFIMIMGGTLIMWALFYMIFTIHGVALRDAVVLRAVQASFLLMRFQFPPAMGLILLIVAIYFGTGLLWNLPPLDSWVHVAGIVGHAFTVTGLLAATAMFYMDRTRAAESGQ
jgi:hypothetical protein